MELIESIVHQYPASTGIAGDAAAYVLSRFPHPDTATASDAAFIDTATGRSFSFSALRRAALSLAAALRLGLGLRRGNAVLILSPNSLLFPPIVIGVLAAGGVVVTADPDATAAEIAAVARGSGAEIVVATPEVASKVAGVGVPVLLTSRSPDPRSPLSAEELMDGGDPTVLAAPEAAAEQPGPSDVAAVVYSPAGKGVVLTHADLIAAIKQMTEASSLEAHHVCLGFLPMCDVHGLALLALGIPAAGATTVIMPQFDAGAAREALNTHSITLIAAAPAEVAAVAAGMTQGWDLLRLRRVMAAPPLTTVARQEFHRRLPWVQLMEMHGTPEKNMGPTSPAELGNLLHAHPDIADAAVTQKDGEKPGQALVTSETVVKFVADQAAPYKKIQKIAFGDAIAQSSARKVLRKHLVTGNRHAISKL